jgi:hypothetical protein
MYKKNIISVLAQHYHTLAGNCKTDRLKLLILLPPIATNIDVFRYILVLGTFILVSINMIQREYLHRDLLRKKKTYRRYLDELIRVVVGVLVDVIRGALQFLERAERHAGWKVLRARCASSFLLR